MKVQMRDEKRIEMQQVGTQRAERRKEQKQNKQMHCIEQTWAADEVFTAARSSLGINSSACHTDLKRAKQCSRNVLSHV